MSLVVLLNKPFHVLPQFTDSAGRGTLADYIDNPNVRVAGRLDYDSEGLMVLTDSGKLNHKITHPNNSMGKTYWVQVEGQPDLHSLAPMQEGEIHLKDGPCRPARVRLIQEPPDLWTRDPPVRFRKSVPDQWLEITLHEGRNRQVRRMCAHLGFPVLRLIRYRVGSWTLDGLRPGDIRAIEL